MNRIPQNPTPERNSKASTSSGLDRVLDQIGIYFIFGALFGAVLALSLLTTDLAEAELKKLNDTDLRRVTGQEGLNMILEDFRISGNQTIRLRQDDYSNPDSALFLSDVSLDDGSGGGVTIGSTSDPISFDIEGSNYGRWVIELPDNYWNIDPTDITISKAWWQDASSSFGTERRQIADQISITNAQWAGGTRIALGTWPGGGLQAGLGIVLDGDVTFSAPSYDSDFVLNQIGGFNSCSNGPTNFDIDTDCSGVLDWASLEQGRPLVLEMFTGSDGEGKLSFELNPNYNSGSAGQIVVESARFNNDGASGRAGGDFGEIWTNEIIITNMKGKGPISIPGKGDFTGRTTGCTHSVAEDDSCPSLQ